VILAAGKNVFLTRISPVPLLSMRKVSLAYLVDIGRQVKIAGALTASLGNVPNINDASIIGLRPYGDVSMGLLAYSSSFMGCHLLPAF
jgi:hypothetical protein